MNTPTPMTETDEDRESLARGEIPAHIAMPSNVAATPLTDELLAKARTKKLLSSDPRLPWYRLAVKLERDLAAAQERVEDLEVRCANAEARAGAFRSALLELRIRLHSAGRRPEECHEMSLIDAAIAEGKK